MDHNIHKAVEAGESITNKVKHTVKDGIESVKHAVGMPSKEPEKIIYNSVNNAAGQPVMTSEVKEGEELILEENTRGLLNYKKVVKQADENKKSILTRGIEDSDDGACSQ
eukprot:gene36730-45308_t